MSINNDQYFGSLEGDELVQELNERITKFCSWRGAIEARWRKNYQYLYGNFFDEGANQISYSGEQGETTQISVNHFRNIHQHLVNMITSAPPTFNCQAANSDAKSLTQARLGNNILEYYLKEKKLSDVFSSSVENCLAFDADYIYTYWDIQGGEEYSVDLNNQPVKSGDLGFKNISAWDIILDTTKVNFQDNDWMIIRTFKSKWGIINSLPDRPDIQEKLKTIESSNKTTSRLNVDNIETDDIDVYIFMHKKSAVMPNGRYVEFCSDDIILIDTDLPYREIPVRQMAAGKNLASQFGYSVLNSLAPIQEAINMEYSTILTNHEQFGVQNILVPREANVRIRSLIGGVNSVEYDSSAGAPPSALNLVQTPAEIFNALSLFERTMETLSGVNSVIRGNPESSLKSGTSLALVQNQALAFANFMQQSYKSLIEKVGQDAINILRDFSSSERVISIAGKFNRSSMKEFTSDELVSINRVSVEMGNDLSKTTAGRVEMATNLLSSGLIKTPEEYIQILQTGNIESMTEHTTSALQLIRNENEDMMDGIQAVSLVTDDHRLHILEHKSILDNTDIRKDNNLSGLILNHIQVHIQMMQDPMVGTLQNVLGQMSLPPQQLPSPQQVPQEGQVDPTLIGGLPNPNEGQSVDSLPGQPPVDLPSPAQPPPGAMPR